MNRRESMETHNSIVNTEFYVRVVRTDTEPCRSSEVQDRISTNSARLIAADSAQCFVRNTRLSPSTGSGRTVLLTDFGIDTNPGISDV